MPPQHEVPERDRPTGTVSFLFTDVEDSTGMWERSPAAMADALDVHDRLVRDVVGRHSGVVFATGGDGFAIAFDSAGEAVAAAIEAQQMLRVQEWPPGATLRVRMGAHSGEVVERRGDYFGPAVNLCARLMGAAHGGQIVCTRTVADLVGERVHLRPLGDVRLRGIESMVAAFQVAADGVESEFPPLRTLDTVRNNLPSGTVALIGRDDLVSEVIAQLGGARLVSVVGVGGVGKTSVAVQVGRQLESAFADGVWLCELAPVDDPDRVIDAIAAALRFSPPPGVPLLDALVEHLAPLDLLLVLDNCEHLLVGAADTVALLLAACPAVRVVATSREALGVAGERVLALPPLGVPSTDDPDVILSSSAGALFVARARDARHDWGLDQGNAVAVAQICRTLDGIPLAVELAAARSAALDANDIARRLDERFTVLSRPARTGQSRHQTLRAAIDWSYELLEPREQELLMALAVFVGGFDVDATVAVAAKGVDMDEWAAFDGLASLVTKSLVERHPSTVGRYRLLETIRQYASDRADEAGIAGRLQSAHARHYVAVLAQALEDLRTSDGTDETVRLALEAGNIDAALRWCGDHGLTADALVPFERLPGTVLLTLPGAVSEPLGRALEYLLTQHGASEVAGFSAACAAAANLLADDADRSRLERVREARRAVADDAFTAMLDAAVEGEAGNMPGGVVITERGLVALGDGDPILRSALLGLLAIFEGESDPAGSRAHAEEAVGLARRHGGAVVLVSALLALTLATLRVDVGVCTDAAEEAARLDRSSRRTFSTIAISLAGHASASRGDLARAVPLMRESLAQLARSGNRQGVALTLGTTADAIAEIAPDLALELVCVAESGVFKQVGILTNEQFQHVRALAATSEPLVLDAMRARFAAMSYDEAAAFVLDSLDDLMSPSP